MALCKVQEKGRGRKLCTACSKYVGVKTRICECGNIFDVKSQEKKNNNAVRFGKNALKVPDAYSGEVIENIVVEMPKNTACPVALSSTNLKDVIQWAQDTRAHFIQEGKHFLTNHALIKLASSLKDVDSQVISNIITDNIHDAISTN